MTVRVSKRTFLPTPAWAYDYNYSETLKSMRDIFPTLAYSDKGTLYRKLTLGRLSIYFYGNVPVAYSYDEELVCMKNERGQWGLGMVLNTVQPDKKKRVSIKDFLLGLLSLLQEHNLMGKDVVFTRLLDDIGTHENK